MSEVSYRILGEANGKLGMKYNKEKSHHMTVQSEDSPAEFSVCHLVFIRIG